MEVRYLKLEIFVPETHFGAVRAALCESGAGHIGAYDCCMAYSRVTGMWRPLAGTHPYIGRQGEVSEEPELKVEVTVRAEALARVMAAVRAAHPYEEPLINVLPLYATGLDGIG